MAIRIAEGEMSNNPGERVIVLSNRAPSSRSSSGLVTALEPLLEAFSGTWVAQGAGSAAFGGSAAPDVPPANRTYRVRHVPLPEDEYQGYYFGFANEGLWPLCHAVEVTPVFRRRDYEMYRAANTRFALAVSAEAAGGSPVVLVQDYHFALAPRMLRQRSPQGSIVAFWHIPWPHARRFRSCPWAAELLDGLLGSDIVGLQTDDDCRNFLGCVEALLPAAVDVCDGTVRYRGRVTTVRAYPVGVNCQHDALRLAPSAAASRAQVCQHLGLPIDVRLGIGVDRMDYTKGLNEKFLAVERLLELRPGLAGKFAFVQIAEPSRDGIAAYRDARRQVRETRDRINARFGGTGCMPIRLLEEHHEPVDVYRYYRAADFCYVNSLQDGMNLVAKEFVSARSDHGGVLVLSEFAGAARQLRSALQVNPRQIDRSAATLAQALDMPAIEQALRMRLMRDNVSAFDASWWANTMVSDAIGQSAMHARYAGAEAAAVSAVA
jgi:trehalose 6-phosphate synthase